MPSARRIGTHTGLLSRATLSFARSRSAGEHELAIGMSFRGRSRSPPARGGSDGPQTDVYVCNIADRATDEDLHALFERYGPVRALPLRRALRLRQEESCRCVGAHKIAMIACVCAAVASDGAGSVRCRLEAHALVVRHWRIAAHSEGCARRAQSVQA